MLRSLAVVAVLVVALPALAKAKKQDVYEYKVAEGDTLQCLDAKYGIQPGELAMLNGSPGKMTYKLVSGKTIKVPVSLKKNACAGFVADGEKGAKAPLGERACQVIDRAKKYTAKQAIAALEALRSNHTCLKAIEIAAQPSVSALCTAFANAMHAHHLTHAFAEGVEVLCESAHLAAHNIHEATGTHH